MALHVVVSDNSDIALDAFTYPVHKSLTSLLGLVADAEVVGGSVTPLGDDDLLVSAAQTSVAHTSPTRGRSLQPTHQRPRSHHRILTKTSGGRSSGITSTSRGHWLLVRRNRCTACELLLERGLHGEYLPTILADIMLAAIPEYRDNPIQIKHNFEIFCRASVASCLL